MERPPSQVENARPSGLKPPSRLPALSSGRTTLQETTSSDVNARAGNGNGNGSGAGSMGPPSSYPNGLNKHKLNNPPEPPTKRKTLVDRAGEAPSASRTGIPNKPSFSSTAGFGIRPTSIYQQSNRSAVSLASASASASSIGSVRPGSSSSSSRQLNGFRQTAPGRPPSAANVPLPEYDQESDEETGGSGNRKAWDVKGRLGDMEKSWEKLQAQMQSAADSKAAIEERIAMYKSQVEELREENRLLTTEKRSMTTDLERARNELHTTSTDLRQARRDQEREMHDLERRHERQLADLELKREKEEHRAEREREKSTDRAAKDMDEAKKVWQEQHDTEITEMRDLHWQEQEKMREDHDKALSKLQKEIDALQQAGQSRASESATEVQSMRETITSLQSQLDESISTTKSLRSLITTYEARIATLELEKNALVSKTHFLEGNQEAQSSEFTTMREKLQDAIAQKDATLATLRKEEMLRRKLNAMILELRGNIRVFVRTRPLLNGEDDPAKVEYVDEDSLDRCKEMVVHANPEKTATGKQRNEKHNYAFDRVFTPGSSNHSVFEECQDLIQSVVDGYNVSILSYGQTGSGKTFGMSGPEGIIPSSIKLLLTEMQRLKEKGWEYAVDASFVEVYNETLNDLLGDAKKWDDEADLGVSTRGKKKEKHEIHHDANTGKTTVTNLTIQSLWPPPTDEGDWPPPAPIEGNDVASKMAPETYTEKAVANLLDTAAKNRRVAATKANERSSRSHSIFILTLRGSCAATGESSEGILNLVDLAGSERLKQSGAEGSRMKETQAINKSLSSLGDVIAALGNKGGNSDAHVPYRNSKLTYLLQSSLGGTTAGKSSRTLMLLHLSPLQTHWQESRSSLLFGSKVHGTHIGTAKKR